MKIILSSKVLANKLSKINWDDDIVRQVKHNNKELIVKTQKKTITIECHAILLNDTTINQDWTHWGSVYDIVKAVPEQPITLDISEKNVYVIFGC